MGSVKLHSSESVQVRLGYESGTNLAKMNTKEVAFFFLLFCFIFETESLYVDQAAFELRDLSAFASRVLGLKTGPPGRATSCIFPIPLDSRIACFLKSKPDLRATELGGKTSWPPQA